VEVRPLSNRADSSFSRGRPSRVALVVSEANTNTDRRVMPSLKKTQD